MPSETRYIPGLDGLRAIAVGTVFLCHSFPNLSTNPVGVDIFFVLSGFLITRGLVAQRESTGRIDIRQFYIRRARRLMPALALMAGSFLIVSALGTHFRQHLIASLCAITYVMNWSRAFHLGPADWLEHTWSLSIEEQFYLLWPLVLTAMFRSVGIRGAAWGAGALAILSVIMRVYLFYSGADGDRIYNGFDARADCLLIGCVLALTRPFSLSVLAAKLWFVPVAIIGSVSLLIPWSTMLLPSTIVAAASAWLVLILWSGKSPWLAAILEFRPVSYAGRISYGLYLWHWPVLSFLWAHHFERDSIGTAMIAGSLTLLAAAASFRFVEQPVMQFRGWASAKSAGVAGERLAA